MAQQFAFARIRFPKDRYKIIREKAKQARLSVADLCRYATYRVLGMDEAEADQIKKMAELLEELKT